MAGFDQMNESPYWMQGKSYLNEPQESLAQSQVEMNGERANLFFFFGNPQRLSVKFASVWRDGVPLGSSQLEFDAVCGPPPGTV